MSPFDLKKIITSFLVLSVATGTAVFIFSTFSLPAAPRTPDITATASSPAKPSGSAPALPAEPLPTGSFTADLPASPSSGQSPTSTPEATTTNLTDQIVAAMVGRIVETNPDGPQTSSDGKQTLAVPADLADALARQISDKTLSFIFVPLQEDRIRVKKDYAPADFEAYFSSLKNIVDGAYVNDGIARLAKAGDPTTGTLAAANLVLSQAEEKLYALPVPEPAEKLHRAVLSYVIYQKAVFDPATDSDPARSLTLAQGYDIGIQLRTKDIRDQLDQFTKNPPSLLNKKTGLLEKILLPKTAYAFFLSFVFDVPTEVNTFGQWMRYLAQYLYHQVLVIIKQQIVHRMVMQTINWVQGGGKPQFITNWEGYLSDVGNNAAGIAISGIAPGLCQSFGPLIQLQLRQQYLNYIPPYCTLDRVVSNVDNFYNSFENGGWLAYGAMSLPSGNYYGSMLQAQIAVSAKMNSAQQSQNSTAQANKGFLGKDECVHWVHESAGTGHYEEVPGHFDLVNGQNVYVGGGQKWVQDPPQDYCDEWKTLTPGETIGSTLDSALGLTPFENIISADDIGALVDAMINSALQHMITSAKGALADALRPGAPVAASQNVDPCIGLTGDEYNQCKGITGTSKETTGSTSSTDVSGTKDQLLSSVKSIASQLKDAETADASWLDLAPQAETAALSVAASCPSLSAGAVAAAQAIDAASSTVKAEYAAIAKTPEETCSDTNTVHSLSAKLACEEGDVLSAKTAEDLQAAQQDFSNTSEKIQPILSAAPPGRFQKLQDFVTAATAATAGAPASCPASLHSPLP